MPRREKFGKFVLLEQVETTSSDRLSRAAKLGTTGFEKIVCILRLSPSVSANLGAAKRLMDQVKVAAPLQNPNILKIFGIGKVEASLLHLLRVRRGQEPPPDPRRGAGRTRSRSPWTTPC